MDAKCPHGIERIPRELFPLAMKELRVDPRFDSLSDKEIASRLGRQVNGLPKEKHTCGQTVMVSGEEMRRSALTRKAVHLDCPSCGRSFCVRGNPLSEEY